MEAANATSERSFSTLRRIKSYLRSKEYTDQLDLVDIGSEFVRESPHRQCIFGKFLQNDS